MSIESMMPSNHLLLFRSLLLLPSFFPSIRVLSNESVRNIRWPKYQSYSISPSREYSGLISFSRASPPRPPTPNLTRPPVRPSLRQAQAGPWPKIPLPATTSFGTTFSEKSFWIPPISPHPCHLVGAAFGWQNIPLIHSAGNFLDFSSLPHHTLSHLCVPWAWYTKVQWINVKSN